MIAPWMTLMLLQPQMCSGEAARHVERAAARAEAFDLAGAAAGYFAAAARGCADVEVTGHYLRGLAAAREAYRHGGSAESLAPVVQAMAQLEVRAAGMPGIAQIARVVLQAAAAAAQSEREGMALLIGHAVDLENVQIAAGQPVLPGVSAHEAAGDLWLQVHRYEEARRAYEEAARRVGSTSRVLLGQARVAARTNHSASACRAYGELVRRWTARGEEPAEVAEAREYAGSPQCLGSAAGDDTPPPQ